MRESATLRRPGGSLPVQPVNENVQPGHPSETQQRLDSGESRRGRGLLPEIGDT